MKIRIFPIEIEQDDSIFDSIEKSFKKNNIKLMHKPHSITSGDFKFDLKQQNIEYLFENAIGFADIKEDYIIKAHDWFAANNYIVYGNISVQKISYIDEDEIENDFAKIFLDDKLPNNIQFCSSCNQPFDAESLFTGIAGSGRKYQNECEGCLETNDYYSDFYDDYDTPYDVDGGFDPDD